jgi:hypothetical protein
MEQHAEGTVARTTGLVFYISKLDLRLPQYPHATVS